MAKKVQLNSAFGVMGCEHFMFFDVRIAEAITLTGQLVIRWVERDVNAYLNRLLGVPTDKQEDFVIAIDTDSVYIRLEKIVDHCIAKGIYKKDPEDMKELSRFVDHFCKDKLSKVIDKASKNFEKYLNVFKPTVVMKREVIADRGVWVKRKRYILNVWNSEGVEYNEPKLKIMGLDVIKSSTPMICRQRMKDTIRLIISGDKDKVIDHIDSVRKEFAVLPVEDISFPKSVNNLSKYRLTSNRIPINVRAALVYNQALERKGLKAKYPPITDGSKIRYCYLHEPNPIGGNVIAFSEILPPEFGLDAYVNRALQFEKVFHSPMRSILDAIGWSSERVSDLSCIFE